jgi:SAM-dependent MidA family methyltransferase
MNDGPQLQRLPLADVAGAESDPGLVAAIRSEIERSGPISFARFMEVALYDSERGYYRSAVARPGRGGDFLTAPEAHPIFGWALARHVDDVWRALGRPDGFAIRELGAGSGALAEALLTGLAADRSALAATIRHIPVDVEPRRVDELRDRLASAGLADRIAADDGRPIVGLVLANEVLDALPTHRVIGRAGGLREIFVGWGDAGFADVEGAPSTPALEERLAAEGISLADGQQAEVCLAVDGWVAGVAAGVERGIVLLIDYGHPAAELYDAARRPAGTLAAYHAQRVHGDPYVAVGRQDLTAHVDVTAVERAASRAGLVAIGSTTQATFLAALGAGDLLVGLQSGPDASLQSYLEARSALVRMIDPRAMGGFRVMAFGRGVRSAAGLRGLDPGQSEGGGRTPSRTTPDYG